MYNFTQKKKIMQSIGYMKIKLFDYFFLVFDWTNILDPLPWCFDNAERLY